ncbi:hypothetical protein PSPO01_12692 [Paraphaeosphaeria sporulosa]
MVLFAGKCNVVFAPTHVPLGTSFFLFSNIFPSLSDEMPKGVLEALPDRSASSDVAVSTTSQTPRGRGANGL